MEELILQHCSSNKLIADAILEAAVDLRTTAVSMEDLEHLHLPVPVQVKLRHSSVQSHQNTARLLERANITAKQLVGDAFCECLEGKTEKILTAWILQVEQQLRPYEHYTAKPKHCIYIFGKMKLI